ncbi:MAG TPA: glycosyltransferase [Planctomycetaceae bacterium]|nr:glycosyltransferase [Planctomycetaceae bacterium]
MAATGPAVSVIIPLFQKEETVERAIRSVLSQTVQDFEIVVVNDGSTDDGPEVVRRIGDPRIRLLHQSNQGVSAARNRGIAEARAELIAFLDADDEWLPGFLEAVLGLEEKYPQAGVFATNYYFCDGEGRYSLPRIRGLPKPPWEGILEDYFAVAARSDPPLWTSAVCVRKKAIQSVGGFPTGVASGEDLLTWARLAVRGQVAYSSAPCAIFRRPQLGWDSKPRIPDVPDVVGGELRRLRSQATAKGVSSVNQYIALWHRMRATSYLALGRRRAAFREVLLAAQAGGWTLRLVTFCSFAVLPASLGCRLMNAAWLFLRWVRAVTVRRTQESNDSKAAPECVSAVSAARSSGVSR